MKRLNTEILEYLTNKTSKKESTIRKDISLLRRRFPSTTMNAAAQIYAEQHGLSVRRMLDQEDKATIPQVDIQSKQNKIPIKKNVKKEKIEILIEYKSKNFFIKKHIEEVNRAYTYKCYTAVNILLRKIIENLVIDILREKYPPDTQENKEIYYDIKNKRYKDFSIILRNLYDHRDDFGTENKLIERLYNLTKDFKDQANDNAHSLYYVVTKKNEIDNLEINSIFEMIITLEKELGIR